MSDQQQEVPQREYAYNADAAAADRAKKRYRVDGVDYSPRRKTGRVVKEIIELGGNVKTGKDASTEDQVKGLDMLYQQVALLLTNEHDENPDPERLMDVLDLDDAKEMVGRLFNNGKKPKDEDEDDEEGEDNPPS